MSPASQTANPQSEIGTAPAAPDTCAAPAAPPQPIGGEAPAPNYAHVAEWAKAEARQTQAALLSVLERWNDPLLTRAELEQIACANWKRICGKPISARHVRRLLARVIDRDAGRSEWTNLSLYLRDNPPLAPRNSAELSRDDEPLAEVLDVLTCFANPSQPTHNELARLRKTAWLWYHGSIQDGLAPKAAKAQLLRFLLHHAPWLAPRRNALRVTVGRWFKKLDCAQGNDIAALARAALDGRHARRGEKRKPEIPQSDALKIAAYAVHGTGGRLAQAKRELVDLREQSGLSEATRDLLDTEGGSKSYVNHRVAQAVQPLIRAAAPYVLGKQAVDDATPSLMRDYSKLHSMQVVTADDYTWPVYFYLPDDKGWFTLTRGQCLLFIDVRSLKIVTWCLIPERNYTGLAIRTAMNTVCLDEARPDFWYFERGLWKSSNLVQGKPPREWRLANPSWEDTAHGWEKLGVRFIHAKRARSKPAELVGGLLQNLMERCPGYCGREERHDTPEETKRAKLAVDAKRENPSKHFYSFDQWVDVLGGLIDRYNAEKQEGRILDGRSPTQAFQEFWPHNRAVKFDPLCWHLCAHYVSERKVTHEGIRFKLGKDWFQYNDEALGPYRNQTVLAWFDPGHPELLCVTDLDQKAPVFVNRSNPVDFLAALAPDSPEAEHYRAEVAKQAGFNRHARAVFRSTKAEFNRTYRQNIVPRPTAVLGLDMLAKRNAARQEQDDGSRRRNRILNLCRETDTPPDTLRDFSEETEASLRRRAQRRRQDDRAGHVEEIQ